MKTKKVRLAVLGGVVGIVLATAPPVAAQSTCVVRTNIQAIIDDSGSMGGTDPTVLRVAGMNLFIDQNNGKTLGAVAFGTDATSLFTPLVIDSVNGPNMKNVLAAQVQADDGTTDYNDAFARAAADNPGAQARIFLTDGGHNEGDYMNGHVGGPPTYVIGFGGGLLPEDHARLAQIAADTGGIYFQETDNSKLQSVFNNISAALNCQAPPKTWTDTFTRVGQTKKHRVLLPNVARTLGRAPRLIELVTTWSDASARFTIPRKSIKIIRNGKTVAARVRKLRVTRVNGQTFAIVRIQRAVRGRLVFQVKAVRLASTFTFGTTPNQAVTQASFR